MTATPTAMTPMTVTGGNEDFDLLGDGPDGADDSPAVAAQADTTTAAEAVADVPAQATTPPAPDASSASGQPKAEAKADATTAPDDSAGRERSGLIREMQETRETVKELKAARAASDAREAAYQQQLAAYQQQLQQATARAEPDKPAAAPSIPDPMLDPAAYHAHMQAEMQRIVETQVGAVRQQAQADFTALRFNQSQQNAVAQFGKDEVAKVIEFVGKQDPGFAARLDQTPDPFHHAFAAYRQAQVQTELGGSLDIAAYRTRIATEERAKVEAEVRQQIMDEMRAGKPAPSSIPPTLATQMRGGGTPIGNRPQNEFGPIADFDLLGP